MTLNEIKEVMNSVNHTDNLPNFQELFENLGYKYTESYFDEDKESNSTNVNWVISFNISNEKENIDLNVSGTAIAEYSYDKWVDTFGYSFDSDNISLVANRVIVENETKEDKLKTYELYLFGKDSYQHFHNENLHEENIYFKNTEIMVSNDFKYVKEKDENEYYQFTEKDLKKIKNIDFFYNILDYTDFNSKISQLKETLDLNYDFNKFQEFNSSFKEHILYDNSKTDLEESISIVYYNDKEIGYLLDCRGKRDNNDYFYFKNEEILKEILIDFLNTFDDNSKTIINFDKFIEKIDFNDFNVFSCYESFKTISEEIDKETYELNHKEEINELYEESFER